MDKNYGGVIWTNHAINRLYERGIKQGDAWATWRNPDQSRFATSKGAWIYYKTYGNKRIEVVAKQLPAGEAGNEKKEWIILSVWSKYVNLGSNLADGRGKSEGLLTKLLKLFKLNSEEKH